MKGLHTRGAETSDPGMALVVAFPTPALPDVEGMILETRKISWRIPYPTVSTTQQLGRYSRDPLVAGGMLGTISDENHHGICRQVLQVGDVCCCCVGSPRLS